MRNWIMCVAASVAISACGPSGKELAVAKTARYQGDKLAIFNATKAVVEDKYKLDKADETTLGMQTTPRWYTPDGLVAGERGSSQNQDKTGNNSLYPDRSVRIFHVVRLLPDGDKWVVSVTPMMERYFAGRPNTDKLTPDDPSVPGWATSQVDQLQFDIYNALKPYEVKQVGGMAPPPAAIPPPAMAPTAPPAAGGEPAPSTP